VTAARPDEQQNATAIIVDVIVPGAIVA